MSADAWRVCPKCLQKAENKKESSYGKVSEEQYLRILSELDNLKDEDIETLREDYEMFTNYEGKFYVSYSCSCSVCHFNFEYKYEKDLMK
jgi:hypothetical protein